MTPEDLQETFDIMADDEDLAPHIDFVRGITKPCVDLELVEDEPADVARSRFGGAAYVPADFVWPQHNVGHYEFLGQINFADIEAPPAPLPTKGLLSFFYAYHDEEEIFWQDPGFVVAFYWPETEGFIPRENPTARDSEVEVPVEGLAISPTTGTALPCYYEARDDWPFEEDSAVAEFLLGDCPSEYPTESLLGFPFASTLGYDPTPEGGDWVSLLTLSSLEELDWCWHDGDMLLVFIEKDKLAQLDFSNLKSDAG